MKNCKCLKNPEKCSNVNPRLFTTCLVGNFCCRCNCNKAVMAGVPSQDGWQIFVMRFSFGSSSCMDRDKGRDRDRGSGRGGGGVGSGGGGSKAFFWRIYFVLLWIRLLMIKIKLRAFFPLKYLVVFLTLLDTNSNITLPTRQLRKNVNGEVFVFFCYCSVGVLFPKNGKMEYFQRISRSLDCHIATWQSYLCQGVCLLDYK